MGNIPFHLMKKNSDTRDLKKIKKREKIYTCKIWFSFQVCIECLLCTSTLLGARDTAVNKIVCALIDSLHLAGESRNDK